MSRAYRGLAVAAVIALGAHVGLGCESEVEDGGLGGQGAQSTGGSGGSGGSGAIGGSGGSGGSGATGGSGGSGGAGGQTCAGLSDQIASQVSGPQTCTTTVRLDYQSLDILGFQIFCGVYGQVDEAQARATAQGDTGFGTTGSLLSGPEPVGDEFVFFQAPGDFGGVGVVGARHGLTVFGGSIIWMGTGEISYPATWQAAADLGPDCIPETNALPPEGRGFELESGTALDANEIDGALTQAWVTALPDGLMQVSDVFDAMVLLYAPEVGGMNPDTAEWIVLLNSGWLE